MDYLSEGGGIGGGSWQSRWLSGARGKEQIAMLIVIANKSIQVHSQ